MLQLPHSPVPSISISFAPHELPPIESKSLFTPTFSEEPDSPRPLHLLPPSPMSPIQSMRKERHGQLSPLSPSSSSNGKGLERERFEAMLKASKERSAMVGAKKPVELRKEIAMKAQKAKQSERRARFLSKLVAPPSPSAADMPVTPPDSPAVFHFSLPSPGLVSPLELFEDLASHPELYNFKSTIEQVDFRLPQQKRASEAAHLRRVAASGNPQTKTKPLPSLDQISERLSRSSVSISTVRPPSAEEGTTVNNRLPSFLRSRTPLTAAEPFPAVAHSPATRMPRQPRPALPTFGFDSQGMPVNVKVPAIPAMPPSPKSPRPTKLQITTTICPPSGSKSSPTEFTEANITEFGTTSSAVIPKRTAVLVVMDKSQDRTKRVQASKDLFDKLSRRTTGLPGAAACGVRAQDDLNSHLSSYGGEDKLKRRRTAPAEMSSAQRGARHAVLDKPGGF